MEIKEKQKILILIAIVGVAFLIIYYMLFLKPQFTKFLNKNSEFSTVKKRVDSARKLIASKEKIYNQLEALKARSSAVQKKLPDQESMSSLLGAFSSIAESSGVSILKIKPVESETSSPAAKTTKEAYDKFSILIEAKAGYFQLVRFVDKLENMDRFIEIDDIEVRNDPNDPRRHDIKMDLKTYVMK